MQLKESKTQVLRVLVAILTVGGFYTVAGCASNSELSPIPSPTRIISDETPSRTSLPTGVPSRLPATSTGVVPALATTETTRPQPTDSQAGRTRAQEYFVQTGLELKDSICPIHCLNAPRNPITLEGFIRAAGPPEKAYSIFEGPSGRFIVVLIYIKQGMILHADRYLNNNYTDATPDMMVYRIDLYRSLTLDGISHEMTELDLISVPMNGAQDWTGFGPVRSID